MAYAHYERLTALDASFLALENHDVHMHVGAVALFEAGPLARGDGSLDFERIRAATEAVLGRSPRFRQRLAWIPLLAQPVWVDDERFNLHYHLRHTSLPRPGDERQLKRLAGRILSQQLDRGKPLWELWFVEGLEGDRFATITKVHHCMIDGIAGVDLLGRLMQGGPELREPPRAWLPRPAPPGRRLLSEELARRGSLPVATLGAARRALADPRRALLAARDTAEGLAEALAPALRPASATPLNPNIGPHRRFDWTRFDLGAVREVRERLGGTVNDVALATATGALRRFLRARGMRVEDLAFRAMLPFSTRKRSERGRLGNRVSFGMVELPLGAAEPDRRLRAVVERTGRLKRSKQMYGAECIERISDWTSPALFVRYARLAGHARAYNLVVTNVPGPRQAAHLLGSRMLEAYPVVPLYTNQGLGIALLGYDGGLYWGFNSDWDALPDLHDLVEAIQSEFELLRKTASEALPRGARSGRPARK